MNTAAKGASIERRAIRILEERGCRVHRPIRTAIRAGNRWISHANDVFGCVDLIAKAHSGVGRTHWIQVTGGDVGPKIDKLKAIPWNPIVDQVEVWRWVGGNHKRMDGRTGKTRRSMYFQVYRLDEGFRLVHDPEHRLTEARPDELHDATRTMP